MFFLSFSGRRSSRCHNLRIQGRMQIFSFCAVNRVFEKDFEGFRSGECRIRHRINLLYLLNLAEPQKVQILRGRHPKRRKMKNLKKNSLVYLKSGSGVQNILVYLKSGSGSKKIIRRKMNTYSFFYRRGTNNKQ